jgi:hypothetical protein
LRCLGLNQKNKDLLSVDLDAEEVSSRGEMVDGTFEMEVGLNLLDLGMAVNIVVCSRSMRGYAKPWETEKAVEGVAPEERKHLR